MRKNFFLQIHLAILMLVLLGACQNQVVIPEYQPSASAATSAPKSTSTPAATSRITVTAIPITEPAFEQPVIYCGENLQLMGTLQKGYTLTLFKANGNEYYSGSTFITGNLVGEVLVSSEIKGTNLRLQNNTFSKATRCFMGIDSLDGFTAIMLPLSTLLNERRTTEDFEGSLLIEKTEGEVGMEWLTYHATSSSKKDCILYRIITNPYPCNQDCSAIETEPGCECFCANFLYYDENCIPTEINPDCICTCRDVDSGLSPSSFEN